MNLQNNNDSNNDENTVVENDKQNNEIYSYSSKLPPQTEEGIASNGEKGEVTYAKRSINDDIADYKFVSSHHHSHHHHSHSHKSKSASDETPIVQSSRPAKGSGTHKKRKRSSGKEKYLEEYDELVKSNHPAKGSKELKQALKEKYKIKKKKRRKFKGWQRVLLTIISILLALVLITSGLLVWFIYNGSKEMLNNTNIISAPSNVVVQNDGQYVVYNGQTYELNKNMTNILCIGVDKENLDNAGSNTVNGENGQADVLILVAMDTSTGKTTMINISRDTMTDVAIYSASGYYVETVKEQICLSYAYGNGKESSCSNTVTAVERLFYNIPINSYFALDLEGIAALNDAVGGVDVVSPETIGNFKEGESYHLMGKEAENFVRYRDMETLEANSKRMQRQQIYLDSFINTVLQQTKEDITTPINLFNASSPYSCTNLNPSKICYLTQNMLSHNGMNMTTVSVPGELKKGEVYTEFYVNEDEFYKLIIDTYYKPYNK